MNVALRPVTTVSICTGTAMLDHGVVLALDGAVRPLLYVERESNAVALLAEEMDAAILAPAPVWSDVRSVANGRCGRYLRAILRGEHPDLLLGGIPCQPYSVAGRRDRSADERDLWPATARIVRAFRPRWVFVENVAGFLDPDGILRVARELEGMDYRTEARLSSSLEMGANHRRERVFLLAVAEDVELRRHPAAEPGEFPRMGSADGGEALADHRRDDGRREFLSIEAESGRSGPRGSGGDVGHPECARADVRGAGRGPRDSTRESGGDMAGDLVHPLGAGSQGHTGGIDSAGREIAPRPARPAGGDAADLPRYAPARNDWRAWARVAELDPALMPAIEPEVRRMADGLAARADRLRAVGNGVDPLVAAVAFVALVAAHLSRVHDPHGVTS